MGAKGARADGDVVRIVVVGGPPLPSAAFGLAHVQALAYRRFELALAGTGALAAVVLLVPLR